MAAISRWLARNEARHQLQQMSNRQLQDIGIYRGDIERVIRE